MSECRPGCPCHPYGIVRSLQVWWDHELVVDWPGDLLVVRLVAEKHIPRTPTLEV